MKHLRIYLIWFCLFIWFSGSYLACQKSEYSATPTQISERSIIGGKIDLRYPAVGALVENNHAFCTGTLIATRVVLTAAHCIDSKSQSSLTFRIDVPSSSAQGFTSNFYAMDNKNMAFHPNWTGNLSGGHDVAIVVLKKAVDPKVATPIFYNSTPLGQSWVGKSALFLGFGLIESVPKAVSPDTKHGAMIPIVNMQKDRFLTYDSKRSTCHGDSGGPALVTIAGRLVVIGVNSYASSAIVPGSNPPRTKCDGRNGVTRVDLFSPFVQSWLDRFGDTSNSCQASMDCGHCDDCLSGAGKQTCERKASLKQATYCQPCANDQACGGGSCYRFKEGFRCLHKCPADGCCGAGAKCTQWTVGRKQDWYCIPDQNKCPDVACQSDKDCGAGELCKKKICSAVRPPRSPKLCLPCSSHSDCVPASSSTNDHFCIGPKGQGFCSQPCGTADFCPNGFSCQQPYRGAAKQCLPTNGTCLFSCKIDTDCTTGFVCQKGTCERKGGGIFGDFCDPMLCQKGLSCVPTLHGKRCLSPCGTPFGEPGSPCKVGNQCNGTAQCNIVSASIKVCLQPCTSDSQCHGSACLNRVCQCKKDSDCAADAFCNRATGFFSSCLPKKFSRPCQKGFQCSKIGEKSYCVSQRAGSVAHGQPCDAFQRCRPGLVCAEGTGGSRCLEDCTTSRGCALGGLCSAERNGVAVCVCSGNECTSGRVCSAPFYLGKFGYCVTSGTTPSCTSSLECPPAYMCETGKCVPAPEPEFVDEPEPKNEPNLEPTPEPMLEPSPEPILKSEPKPEPILPDEPDAPDERVLIKDAGETSDLAKEQIVELTNPGGCKCDATSTNSFSSFFFGLLLLLGGFVLRLKYPKQF